MNAMVEVPEGLVGDVNGHLMIRAVSRRVRHLIDVSVLSGSRQDQLHEIASIFA